MAVYAVAIAVRVSWVVGRQNTDAMQEWRLNAIGHSNGSHFHEEALGRTNQRSSQVIIMTAPNFSACSLRMNFLLTHSLKGSSDSSSRFRDLSKHSARNANSSSVELKRNSRPVSTSSMRPTKWRRAASVSDPSCKT